MRSFGCKAADEEIVPLIQKLGATSTAEIERLIAELQEAKEHLQSERERIERETLRYTSLTQMASTTAKIISDAVSQWHPARNGAEIEDVQSHAGFNRGRHWRQDERTSWSRARKDWRDSLG